MPIEPIQPIHQVWNPMQAVGPLLEQKRLAQQEQHNLAMEQHAQNQERIKVLQEEVKEGNLFQSFSASNELAKMSGVPPMTPVEYITAKSVVQEAVRQQQEGDVEGTRMSLSKLRDVVPGYAARMEASFKRQAQDETGRYVATQSNLVPAEDDPNYNPRLTASVGQTIGEKAELLAPGIKNIIDQPIIQKRMDQLDMKLMINGAQLQTLTEQHEGFTQLDGTMLSISRALIQDSLGSRMEALDKVTGQPSKAPAVTPEQQEVLKAASQALIAKSAELTTKITDLNKKIVTETDVSRRVGLQSQISAYELMRDKADFQKRYADQPTPRNFKLWQDKERAVADMQRGLALKNEDIKEQKKSLGERRFSLAEEKERAQMIITIKATAASDAGAADIINPVTGQIDYARLVQKSARDQQAYVDSLRSLGNLKEFKPWKDSIETLAQEAERKLGLQKTEKKEFQDAMKSLPSMDDPRIVEAMKSKEPVIFEKGGHKFKIEGKGDKRKWVLAE